MRIQHNINQNWLFSKDQATFETVNNCHFETVHLPHTWNNLDGQNGGEPYYRGECWYKKTLLLTQDEMSDKEIYIEFRGANHISKVWINGHFLGEHRGGFSTFRYNVSPFIKKDGTDELVVSVYNGKCNVYPQMADFTFDGGLYRDVNIIAVNKTHISLDKKGSYGVFVTPTITTDNTAHVRVDAFVTNLDNQVVRTKILDKDNNVCAEGVNTNGVVELDFTNIQLWQARENPYLYQCVVEVVDNDEIVDQVKVHFGLRQYSVDAERGFILNGKEVPLRGVSRHQCRQDMGWAITPSEHKEDVELIKEVGANTIRLAHYQHDQHFYDLCDEEGLVLWAEIPFISVFLPGEEAYNNTMSQMEELVIENYNHPSICFWGISNEISIGGENDELLKNLRDLEALVKKLDPSRLSTIAHVSMLKLDSPQHEITDVIAYNHYFGWYVGDVSENGPWFDHFHKMHPTIPLGISEYGAEAVLSWHTDEPKRKDYTEEYQAYYHEEMLKQFATRPYLWGTYVWNMFDFHADNRDEGGVKGRNNKGLITFDRKTKKDSFFVYKAFWSCDPFVHVTGRRYKDRPQNSIQVKVYSNQPEVTLVVNGVEHSTLKADKIFYFNDVNLVDGENVVVAKAVGCVDDAVVFNKVDSANPAYVLVEDEVVNEDARNWFKDLMPESEEMTFNEDYFSIKDKLGEMFTNPQAMMVLKENIFDQLKNAKNLLSGDNDGNALPMEMIKEFSVENVWDFVAKGFPANALLIINEKLQKVKKK